MLVLTRRPNETLVFPNIGVTIRILSSKDNRVRIGIEGPPDARIMRGELLGRDAQAPALPAPKKSLSHALCNRLNKVTLGLYRFHQQQEAGQIQEAEATFQQVLEVLGTLDQEWVRGNCEEPPGRGRFRTLLVEDDANERELLAGILRMSGCECATAADGLEALEYLAAHDLPDFVLLDMWMPRCDGPRTLAEIRRNPRYRDLKVFAVSGTSPSQLGIPTGPEGIDAWFPKPLNPRRLWDAIQHSAASPSGTN